MSSRIVIQTAAFNVHLSALSEIDLTFENQYQIFKWFVKIFTQFCINSNLYSLPTTQCCVFNNSSIVKHRHQIWDQFVIPVFKTEITNWSWILPQFTSLIRKLALVFFFDGFLGFRKKKFFQPSFRKKITFYI